MKRLICWLLGHKWQSEKGYWGCRRCHKVINASDYNPVSKPDSALPIWKRP